MNYSDSPTDGPEAVAAAREDPPAPTAGVSVVADWARAEAGLAVRLARAAGRFGALDERLRRGPAGWHHRLALIEAAGLSWIAGDRIPADRLALWCALRLSGAQENPVALARAGWAVRRLTGGPGPEAGPGTGLAAFLGRHEPGRAADRPGEAADPFADPLAAPLADRAEAWGAWMRAGAALHPISRACMGYHLWARAGLGGRMEAAVTAARLAAEEGDGAIFAPLAMAGGTGLQASGPPAERLARWLDALEAGCRAAMRHLDGIAAWAARAHAETADISGRTPAALRRVLVEWPLVSAPMAAALTGASRAAVQRGLGAMAARGLLHEVTGQGRFRMWRAAVGGVPV